MYELMVTFGSQGYIYFPTDCTNCEDAVESLYRSMKRAGINTDNLCVQTCELRDKEMNNIDAWNKPGQTS